MLKSPRHLREEKAEKEFLGFLNHCPEMDLAFQAGYTPEEQKFYLFCASRVECLLEDTFDELTFERLEKGLFRIGKKLRNRYQEMC